MKLKYIKIVSIGLGVALLGLIVLQVIYLKTASKVKEEQFTHTVLSSLNRISLDLEHLEITNYKHSPQSGSIIFSINSFESLKLSNRIFLNPSLMLLDFPEHDEETLKILARLKEQGLSALSMYASEDLVKVSSLQKKNPSGDNMPFRYFTFKEFLSLRPILERIDENLLFQLIAQKFKEMNIFIPFEYAIIQHGKILYSSSDYRTNRKTKVYQTQLFPNDHVRTNYASLAVQFHKNTQYGLVSILSLVIPSILITIILVLGSSFTIYTIFKQKRLSRIRNDFINNMTHEFKTPISTISLASQMMTDPSLTKSGTMLDRISNILSKETMRLNTQVERVLQTAAYDKKGFMLKKQEVNIHRLIDELANDFKIKIEDKNGTLIRKLGAKKHVIMGDEIHLANMILNLIDNAVKYYKADKNPWVSIITKNVKDNILISVADKGVGILKKDQKMIFEKFYRVHTGNTHNVKGFGLGLSYVKKIVEMHTGKVKLESTINKGSKFNIYLPINQNN